GRLLASEAGYIPSASTILSLSRPPSGQPGSTLRFAALIAASKMVDPLVGAQGRAPTRRAPTPTTIGSMFLHFAIDKVSKTFARRYNVRAGSFGGATPPAPRCHVNRNVR